VNLLLLSHETLGVIPSFFFLRIIVTGNLGRIVAQNDPNGSHPGGFFAFPGFGLWFFNLGYFCSLALFLFFRPTAFLILGLGIAGLFLIIIPIIKSFIIKVVVGVIILIVLVVVLFLVLFFLDFSFLLCLFSLLDLLRSFSFGPKRFAV